MRGFGENQMNLTVSKIRAINSADIKLDGITVVTGENGCGKTTLSKLLYVTINTSNNFDKIVRRNLNIRLRSIIRALTDLMQELSQTDEISDLLNEMPSRRFRYRSLLINPDEDSDLSIYEQKINSYINNIQENIHIYLKQLEDKYESNFVQQIFIKKINRIKRILQNSLNDVHEFENTNSLNEEIIFQLNNIREYVKNVFTEAIRDIETRPIHVFVEELYDYFDEDIREKFKMIEFAANIIEWEKHKFLKTHWIQNCIYIDTPMAVMSHTYTNNEHWKDLISYLKTPLSKPREIKEQLSLINKIISGEVSYTQDTFDDDFVFKRNDGSVFNLKDCATGVKSFGILQILLKNGRLNKNTILIIDEPEAHLHPQWIVEYARIIVLLNKNSGVKFFIASHNPDMISAIKYIAQKEKIAENVNFYIAKKYKKGYTYNYIDLKRNIDPIFESFNIALERINQYGIDQDEE